MYQARAGSIKVEDITSDEYNQIFLQRLRDNDPTRKRMWVQNSIDDDCHYVPSENDAGWMGYFVGSNQKLEEVSFGDLSGIDKRQIDFFISGMQRNRSIHSLQFASTNLFGGEMFNMLYPFFKHNGSLSNFTLGNCNLNEEGCRLLAMALGAQTNGSLKAVSLDGNVISRGGLVDIIVALSMQSKLKSLTLMTTTLNRNECMALATLVQWSVTGLEHLDLDCSGLDDERLETLVVGLLHSKNLGHLDLSSNPAISVRGWKKLLSMMENTNLERLYLSQNNIDNEAIVILSKALALPDSNLEHLHLDGNIIGDTGAIAVANALASNDMLRVLTLPNNNIAASGWAAFSKLLCDDSSINKTFLSNHTLTHITGATKELKSLLGKNRRGPSEKIVMRKMLESHPYFDMQLFFEWGLKVIPYIVNWFDRADEIAIAPSWIIGQRKLSAIYQFIRGMPMMYVTAHSNQELEKMRASTMQMHQAQLKLMIQQHELSLQIKEMEEQQAREARRF